MGKLRPSEVKELDQGSLEARTRTSNPTLGCSGKRGPLPSLLAGMVAEPGDSIPGAPAGESWGGGWGCSVEPGHLSWEQGLSSISSHSQTVHLFCLSLCRVLGRVGWWCVDSEAASHPPLEEIPGGGDW